MDVIYVIYEVSGNFNHHMYTLQIAVSHNLIYPQTWPPHYGYMSHCSVKSLHIQLHSVIYQNRLCVPKYILIYVISEFP